MDGEQQREAILGWLRASRDGLELRALADLLELHPNTARFHLAILCDAGLVEAEPVPHPGRGRPRIAYRLTSAGSAHGRDDYHLLATMLTSALAADPHGEARAYETGLRWGRHLQAAEADADVADLLNRQGFAAQRVDARIEMRRCPFYALAETSPQVICTLHHGLVDGALEEAAAAEHVDRLDSFVEPTLCVAHLRKR